MRIETAYYERFIRTLERALELLHQSAPGSVEYDLYRSAFAKEFEIILEQSGKLLRKALRPYFASALMADRLPFKNIFRHAVWHGLLSEEACERWYPYRDNRNVTAHDYGAGFAEETLKLLPRFLADARALAQIIQRTQPCF